MSLVIQNKAHKLLTHSQKKKKKKSKEEKKKEKENGNVEKINEEKN
jgi:hypothetical protein